MALSRPDSEGRDQAEKRKVRAPRRESRNASSGMVFRLIGEAPRSAKARSSSTNPVRNINAGSGTADHRDHRHCRIGVAPDGTASPKASCPVSQQQQRATGNTAGTPTGLFATIIRMADTLRPQDRPTRCSGMCPMRKARPSPPTRPAPYRRWYPRQSTKRGRRCRRPRPQLRSVVTPPRPRSQYRKVGPSRRYLGQLRRHRLIPPPHHSRYHRVLDR